MQACSEIVIPTEVARAPSVAPDVASYVPGEPFPRGYRAQLGPVAARRLKELHVTQFWRPAGRALATHACAYTLMLAFCWLAAINLALALLLALPAAILMAREMRVLELLVHNASHRNWTRNRPLNDIASALLCGLPMASSIDAYWESHRVHHHEFGSTKDPDRAGFEFLGPLDLVDKRATAKWLVRYAIQYYLAIGASPKFLAASLTWHCAVYILPLSLIAGPALALGAWAALWLFPMLTFLSALRAIAEREEHDYELGTTEFTATFTNIGRAHRILFHPWNDHYHLLHHLYAGMPQFNHVEAHALLMEHDPEYRKCRARIAILGAPVPAEFVAGQMPPRSDQPAPEHEARPIAPERPSKPRVPEWMPERVAEHGPGGLPPRAPRPVLVRTAPQPDRVLSPDAPPSFDQAKRA